MSETTSAEEKQALPADGQPQASEAMPTADAKPVAKKAKRTEPDEEAAPPPKKKAAPARPSIYENITNAAKQKEAERAARAAANKANAASQQAAKQKEATSAQSKKPLSPFLNAPISRVAPAKPAMPPAAVDELKETAALSSEADLQPKVMPPVAEELAAAAKPEVKPAAATDLVAKPVTEPSTAAPTVPTAMASPMPGKEDAKAEVVPTAEKPIDAKAGAKAEPKSEAAPAAKPAVKEPAKDIVPPAKPVQAKPTPPTARPAQPIQKGTPAGTPGARPGQQQRPQTQRPGQSQGRPQSQNQGRPGMPSQTQGRPPLPPAQTQGRPQGQQAGRPQANQQQRPAQGRPQQGNQRPQYGNQQRQHQQRQQPRPAQAPAPRPVAPPAPVVPAGPVALPSVITVRDLTALLNIPVGDMLKKLMTLGIFATINQTLDYDTASTIAEEFDIKTKPAEVATPKVEMPTAAAIRATADTRKGESRPPIVVVMGHVDHGKTSLLDAIRSADVAAGEAGGITQHIGAYQVDKAGRKITFLDTPGHEAFTAMRARGAQLTDVAVLVVAADDGVMPQTVEAINHARAANVPMVVALNKIDRETADPARVMRQLADANVLVEEWGGDVPMVKVSARKIIGIDELLDMILLVADLAEHKADPNLPAIGTVVEAEMDRNRGPVATLLVQNGTLRQNDYLVIAGIQGRVRAMFDDRGNRLNEAGPSTPAVVLGLPSVPEAGTTFQVVADERTAKTMAEEASSAIAQAQGTRAAKALSLDDLYAQMQAGKMHELNLVLKADVSGSLEPIRNSLEKLSTEQLRVRILHQGLGNISESDVSLALASTAIVIGFNVDTDPAAKRVATVEGVDVREYRIIYKLIEDVDKALKGLLEPTYKEVVSGKAEVRAVFKVAKKPVAGSYVTEGKAVRTGQARVLRGGKTVFDGRVESLKRFTEDAREVLTGFECGIRLEGYDDIQVGDFIEFYHKEKVE